MHFLVLIALVPLVFALPPTKRAIAYYDPTANGGAMLTDASGGSSASDLGEPLNVIISGLSSSAVLGDSGFLNFAQSIGFSTECLGIHIGTPQTANLGDGNGYVPQSAELREDYGDPDLGTCLESLIGGNHLRMYRQNGTQANSGALFLAVSQEEDASDNHNIIANGYNVGRDALVAAAVGTTSMNGVTYSTTSKNITGLLAPGDTDINHGISQDGVTMLLTVTIV